MLTALLLGLLIPTGTAGIWRGTLLVDGMIHEPGGYHPYKTTMHLVLREGRRVAVPGGFRVWLVSEGSRSTVVTSVHQVDGSLLCSGTGSEVLDGRFGYLETKDGTTIYHFVIPRAFGAFACGKNNATKRNRIVVIGAGDHEAAEIETADDAVRAVERGGTVMAGSFRSTKSRQPVSYEYEVTWALTQER